MRVIKLNEKQYARLLDVMYDQIETSTGEESRFLRDLEAEINSAEFIEE